MLGDLFSNGPGGLATRRRLATCPTTQRRQQVTVIATATVTVTATVTATATATAISIRRI